MKEFRFSEAQAKKTMISQTVSRIPLMLIAGGTGIYIANHNNNGGITDNLAVLLPVIAIGIVAMSVGLFIGVKNGTKTLLANVYRLSDESIERIGPNGNSTIINLSDIKTHKSIKKGLFLKDQNSKILIPVGIEGFENISGTILATLK